MLIVTCINISIDYFNRTVKKGEIIEQNYYLALTFDCAPLEFGGE